MTLFKAVGEEMGDGEEEGEGDHDGAAKPLELMSSNKKMVFFMSRLRAREKFRADPARET